MAPDESVEESDLKMNEAERAEFAERVLLEDEEIVASFKPNEVYCYVFTSKRLVLETEQASSSGESKPRKTLISIPYGNIALHAVVVDMNPDPVCTSGVLKVWVSGYFNETGSDNERSTINIYSHDAIDLYLLSKILSTQMAM